MVEKHVPLAVWTPASGYDFLLAARESGQPGSTWSRVGSGLVTTGRNRGCPVRPAAFSQPVAKGGNLRLVEL